MGKLTRAAIVPAVVTLMAVPMSRIAVADQVPFQIDGDLDATTGTVDPRTGSATVSGTVACTDAGTVTVSVSLYQASGPQYGSPRNSVIATNSVEFPCNSSWTVTLDPVDGKFRRGLAQVAVQYPGCATGGTECSYDDNSPTTISLHVAR